MLTNETRGTLVAFLFARRWRPAAETTLIALDVVRSNLGRPREWMDANEADTETLAQAREWLREAQDIIVGDAPRPGVNVFAQLH